MRTLEEIKQAIRADFVANITLAESYGLDQDKTFDEQFSTVSLEAILTYIVASAIYLHELIINSKQTELETQIGAAYPFSAQWYHDQARLFQFGDELEFDLSTYKFGYTETDESKKIVQFVAIRQRELAGVTKLQVFAAKAAKAALEAAELAAFTSYIKEIGAAGTHFDFVSLDPDQLELNLIVTYNPQLVDGLGQLITDGSAPVNAAITSYLDNIKYSGKFNRSRLVDAVQAATGVLDVVLGNVSMNGDLTNTQSFESPSGFFQAETINVTYTAGDSNDY